jgi:hypothetical protein
MDLWELFETKRNDDLNNNSLNILNEDIGIVWRKRDGKLVKLFKCLNGPDKGKVVKNKEELINPQDFKKKTKLTKILTKEQV